MTAGVVASAACFVLAVVLELAGGVTNGGRMTDLPALRDGLVAMAPWAWASVGTFVLIVTPAVALLATVLEYLRAGDRVTVGLAVLVLLVLSLGCLVAFVR